MSEALVPGESHRAVVIGKDEAVPSIRDQDLDELSPHIERVADYVRADALRKKGKYNTLLVAHGRDPEAAADHVEEVLDDHTRRFVRVDEIERADVERTALIYLLRLKKNVKVGKMIDRLGCGEGRLISTAELKPLKGLRKKLTGPG